MAAPHDATDPRTVAPYGEWVSPISAADLTAGAHPVVGARFVGDEVWWLELRPDEGGRYAVFRQGEGPTPVEVLPAPWNARTRVHEYGGACWLVTEQEVLVFSSFDDQRLYRLDPGSAPQPLTPVGAVPAGMRYAEPFVVGAEIWCVREEYDEAGGLRRDICAVPLDGSAAEDAGAVRSLVSGSHFLAYPRLSPDGGTLAWIAWDHPNMPWDGTELRVASRDSDGTFGEPRRILGGPSESVLQPEWDDDGRLLVVSDRTGWWNLYTLDASADASADAPAGISTATGVEGTGLSALTSADREVGGPLWALGTRFYLRIDPSRIAAVSTYGTDRLTILDTASGAAADVDLGGHTSVGLCAARGNQLLVVTGGAREVSGLRLLDLATGELTDVRRALDELPATEWLPAAEARTFAGPGGRDVHAIVYPPHSPDYVAPDGEQPPYVAFIHGGPTARSAPGVDLVKAFFTSRGVGVVDVNYGGSTGYGRSYRERLRGQWGVVDVEDTVAAVRGLVDAGLADPRRLAIEGGSAGGWTVLAALTGTDVFACGASYFGVAELLTFATDTHDFESRYLDSLVGPLPEAESVYVERAPLSHVDDLSCPVLLLQGLDDPIVPPSQAEMFRDALVAKGIEHAYRAYAGESHGFRRSETIVDARESELSFYGQVMGFRPPGVPELPLWRPGA